MGHKGRKRIPLKEKICREIRREIVFGSLMPNEHLKEAQVAGHFNCTRGPVREALNQLEQQGFVTLVPNQGASVKEPSVREVEDFYALLAILEGKAVEWATPHLVESDIEQLSTINRSLKEVLDAPEGPVEAWIPLNFQFHRLFREKCGNEKVDWLAEEIRIRITRYRYISLMMAEFGNYAADHEEIIARVQKRQALEAGVAMTAHIHRAKDILVRYLNRLPKRNLWRGPPLCENRNGV
jgi:DNA-binding GntR family transcriptional regulator